MLEFFNKEPQKQFNTAYLMPNREPFTYEAVTRQDKTNLTFSEDWDSNTDTILLKTLSTLEFKKNDTVIVKTKPYLIDGLYTEDNEEDLNSPMFETKRTYTYISLRY